MINKEKAYFNVVKGCCFLLILVTTSKYYLMFDRHNHIRMTLSMSEKSTGFKDRRLSNNSNYTYECPFVTAPPRSHVLKENPFAGRPDNMVVQNVTHKYLEELDRDLQGKNIFIKRIYIGSSPLEGPYQSSAISHRKIMRRQWAGIDFHAFIAFMTSDNTHWALDKNDSGIYVSSVAGRIEPEPVTVILYVGTVDRVEPLTSFCTAYVCDYCPHHRIGYPLENLTHFLKSEVDRKYCLLFDNCQNFAKRVFDEVTKENIWEPLPLIYFFFDRTVEKFISVVVEVSIFANNIFIMAFLTLKEGRKHIKFVCCAYIVWTTSTDISKVDLFSPDYFARIFLSIHFLLRSKFGEILLILKILCIISLILFCLKLFL